MLTSELQGQGENVNNKGPVSWKFYKYEGDNNSLQRKVEPPLEQIQNTAEQYLSPLDQKFPRNSTSP